MKFQIITLLCLVTCLGCQPPPETDTQLRTAVASERDILVVVESAGVIQPHRTVEVKSKASGEILSIHAETGDVVTEGKLLVQVDKRSPRSQLDLVAAEREAALARRSVAETQRARAEKLYSAKSINQVEYENAILELTNSKAEVVRSRVSIENARFALDDTEVKAPITGTVMEKLVEKGQVISSPIYDVGGGTVLMKMADLTTMQVQALVNEIDIGKILPGQQVTVGVTSYPLQSFYGEVLKVEPQAMPEQAVTSFPVLITLDNQSGLLRPGMNADVKIFVEERRNVATVPVAALRTMADVEETARYVGIAVNELRTELAEQDQAASSLDGNRYWVLRVADSGFFEPQYITTGVTDLDYIEVVDGIELGSSVVLLPSTGMLRAQQKTEQRLSHFSRIAGLARRDD